MHPLGDGIEAIPLLIQIAAQGANVAHFQARVPHQLALDPERDLVHVRDADVGVYAEQRAYGQPWAAPGMPRNTPPGNVVCWTPCGQPGAIVLGADPDPFIRQQLLRDASRYFGGGGR